MKTQEEYAREIDEIVRRDVESYQSDWFKIDKEIFMLPENKNKTFILGTRKTGCDLLILGGTNCDESYLNGVFGCLGNQIEMWKSGKILELYLYYYLEDDQPNVWLRIKNGIIETSKNIKIGRAEAERLWKLIKFFHNGSKFQHDMVLDTTGHKWKINSYKNDILVAGCHRIAYSEMEGVARQLGWD